MNITTSQVTLLPLSHLVANTGQIEGVPANPRVLKDKQYKALVKSLKKDNLTGVLPLKVFLHNDQYVVLGGNQRLHALQEVKAEQVACIIVPEDAPAETLRKIVVLDNSTFGEWDMDMLANEWNTEELQEWGVELPEIADTETSRLSDLKINSMYHEPEKHPHLTLEKCVDLSKYNAKMDAIKQMGLTDEQLKVMELFARRFIRIDFESVANYYAFNATDAEKDAIERLRLVLVDGGGAGLIEDGLLRVREELLKEEEDD